MPGKCRERTLTHANARRGMTDQVSGIASIRSSQFAVGSSKTSGAGNLQGLASMPALRCADDRGFGDRMPGKLKRAAAANGQSGIRYRIASVRHGGHQFASFAVQKLGPGEKARIRGCIRFNDWRERAFQVSTLIPFDLSTEGIEGGACRVVTFRTCLGLAVATIGARIFKIQLHVIASP
jgi:hypothetical protein